MAKFSDLPLELLPITLVNLLKPHHLASACLVNKSFHTFAVPWLYNHVSIYSWHREGKIKVGMFNGMYIVFKTVFTR